VVIYQHDYLVDHRKYCVLRDCLVGISQIWTKPPVKSFGLPESP
jgi:hypothetical protein